MDSHWDTLWATTALHRLHQGAVVRNWGAARGYTGGTFKIVEVEGTSITVSGGEISKPRRVSKGEFEKVFGVWEVYLAAKYTRAEMRSLSLNTT